MIISREPEGIFRPRTNGFYLHPWRGRDGGRLGYVCDETRTFLYWGRSNPRSDRWLSLEFQPRSNAHKGIEYCTGKKTRVFF